ncbi:hypothetical protein H8D36_01115 [archaeon]|nr:hypothetical protein [archaeon]
MEVLFVRGLFIIVNTLVSFYIVIYAYFFLSRTKNYPDRRPWEFLLIGACFFLLSEILGIIQVFIGPTIAKVDIMTIRMVFEFLYASLVLVGFITQSQMILMSDMILITRKVERRKEEERKKGFKPTGVSTLVSKHIEDEMDEENFESEIKSEKDLLKDEKKSHK